MALLVAHTALLEISCHGSYGVQRLSDRVLKWRCGDQEVPVCADPESFFFLVDEGEGGSKYRYKWAIIDPPAKHHLNGVLLACP